MNWITLLHRLVHTGLLCASLLGPAHLLVAQNNLDDTRPNILFAIADDWSFGHAGAYGCQWVQTPSFNRVAKSGLLFQRAYTPNAKCAPSRACILTGRNSWQLEAAANHVCQFPAKYKGWVEGLAANGYMVGFTGKGWGPGEAKDLAGKPRQMTGRPYQRRKAAPPQRGMNNNDYSANFKDFLKDVPRNKPWCFWYGTAEPHRGYEYGAGVKRARKKLTDIDRVPGFWPDNEAIRNDMLDYATEVEHFDRHLGRILREIERRGQLENTLVIVTSDHGMPFPRCKGQAYDYSNHVPLAIMWTDGITNPGRVINDFISFVDIAPTILDIAKLRNRVTGMAPVTGVSLTNIFLSTKSQQVDPTRDFVLIGKERHDIGRPNDQGYPIRGIVKGDLLYLRNYEPDRWPAGNPETGYLNVDGSPTKTHILEAHRKDSLNPHWKLCFGKRKAEELYNLFDDPDCVRNLSHHNNWKERMDALRTLMETELKRQGDPRMEGKGGIFDQYPYANAAHRDFYNRYVGGEKVRAGWVNPTDFEAPPEEKRD